MAAEENMFDFKIKEVLVFADAAAATIKEMLFWTNDIYLENPRFVLSIMIPKRLDMQFLY
jgi:hypothetical protein